jgi:class 3 adenylate cyclase
MSHEGSPVHTPVVSRERKLAAILSPDVAGYSRLMGEDEEGTLRTLPAHRAVTDALIQQHRGRITNTAGDSLLAEFASSWMLCSARCADCYAGMGWILNWSGRPTEAIGMVEKAMRLHKRAHFCRPAQGGVEMKSAFSSQRSANGVR